MPNCLIAKPNNNIYLKRDDVSKTDLQSNEILAFTTAIKYVGSFDTIYWFNDSASCISNAKQSSVFYIKQFSYEHHDALYFNNNDTLIIFCGLWAHSNQTAALINLLQNWRGPIKYILNDLRLTVPDELIDVFKNNRVEILTQSTSYENDTLKVRYLAMQYLPLFYISDATLNNTIYDIGYQYMNLKDNDSYRMSKLNRLHEFSGLSKLWIGPEDKLFVTPDNKCTCTVKHYDVHKYLKQCVAAYIVSEQSYIDMCLMPNRVYEALMLGVIPLFDKKTFNSFKSQLTSAALHVDMCELVVKDDFSNVKDILKDPRIHYEIAEYRKILTFHKYESREYKEFKQTIESNF
jgi:hypothetical protein